MLSLFEQLLWLAILGAVVAPIAWTVTHEEVFREAREWCQSQSRNRGRVIQRKFFYMLTCEYCFSHYVAITLVALTRFRMLVEDWRGYLIAWFALVWVANVYISAFGRLRLDIKHERVEIAAKEQSARPEDSGP